MPSPWPTLLKLCLRAVGTRCLAVAACLLIAASADGADNQVLHDHLPPSAARQTPLGRLDNTQPLKLAIGLPLRNPEALTQLLRDLYDPLSPSYRHFLTPAQFTERFAPTEADYERVAKFASAHGLTITQRHSNRLLLDVKGEVADIETVFHVTLRTYRHPGEARDFYAPDVEPSVDPTLPILHVSGLDNYAIPHPNLHKKPAVIPAAQAVTDLGSAPNGALAGKDFRAAYVPDTALTGAGQSVGLLQFDGYYPSDIAAYRQQFALPGINLVNVPIDGGVTTPGSNNVEVCLDIEMAMSMAPGLSNIYVYEAPLSTAPWVDMLNRMATDNLAKQLSCSWTGGLSNSAAEQIFQQMAAQGQSFFSASGDSDAYYSTIPFPADSPNVIQVGATTLTTSSNGAYVSEKAWNWQNGTGTSGGVSAIFPLPSWQGAVSMGSNGGSTTMRNIPDVAMVGDNVYVVCNNGVAETVGGTSCAAPLWAAFTALVNQQVAAQGGTAVGFLNPAIYAAGNSSAYGSRFHDVTTGNNFSTASPQSYPAVSGYDLCTGWGTPAGNAAILGLAKPLDGLQVSSSALAASGYAGGPLTPASSTVTLTNVGTSALSWSAGATQSWVTLSAVGGTLAAGGSTTVTMSLNSGANALPGGTTYSDTVTFTNPATGVRQTRPVTLRVLVPVPVVAGLTPVFTTLYPFSTSGTNGNTPQCPLVQGDDGNFYGTTQLGGSSSNGTVFKITPAGVFTSLAALTITTGYQPSAGLIKGTDGFLYGTASAGGANNNGTVFKTTTGGQVSPVSSLSANTNGALPSAPLALGSDAKLYGTARYGGTSGLGTIFQTTAAGALVPLHSFVSGEGATVITGLVQGDDGGFYGTTMYGGSYGDGTVFKITPAGQFTTLLSFNGSNGYGPTTGLLEGTDGNFYGTTWAGGASGAGTVFRVTPAGVLTTLVSFASGSGSPGFYPESPLLIQGEDGCFYGTTSQGGTAGYGTVFRMTPAGVLTSLCSFPAVSGMGPGRVTTGVVQGTDGNFYGTASVGGSNGGGTVFRLTPPYLRAMSGTAFSYQVSAINNPTNYTATGLPAGMSINASSGLVSGTATQVGTYTVTVTAANTYGGGSATFSLVVRPLPPTITSASSATGNVGASFNYQIAATNNPTRFLAVGLPPGLTVNKSTGLISGVPTVAGTSGVTISALNAGGAASATLTLAINSLQPQPVISSPLAATGMAGTAFSYQIAATNTPTSYSATGLPTGLSVNTATGVISGTPTVATTTSVTINAANTYGTGTAILVLTVTPPPPVISSPLAATGMAGTAFSYQIAATNTPTVYGASNLPAGLSVNTSTGVISGTPTAAATSSVTISAGNVTGTGTATLVLTINPVRPVIGSPLAATGTVGTAFSYQIAATNTPTSYSATGLPTGLSVNTSTGVISGTPIVSTTANVTIGAGNAGGTGTATLVLTINPARPVISSALAATGMASTPFSYRITAANSPAVFGASGLPAGLSANTVTGIISGTPTAAATTNVTISAGNVTGTDTATLVLTVESFRVPVVTSATVACTFGAAFSYQITATPAPTSYSATGLPGGLSVNTTTGLISGAPTRTGTFAVALRATNAAGTGTATLTINVPTVVAWGSNSAGESTVPAGLSGVAALAGGYNFSLALKTDGTVVAWGDNSRGQASVPAGLNNVVAVSAGDLFSLALCSDGTVVGWGNNSYGETAIPPGLSNVVAIGTGDIHGLALKSDGTVVAWGSDYAKQTEVPANLNNVVAIAAGYSHNLALKADGTVVAWGDNTYQESTVPTGLANVVAISAGLYSSLAVKADGTVVGWGNLDLGVNTVPTGLSGVVAVSSGYELSFALKSSGTALGWGVTSGYWNHGQVNVPAGLSGILQISAGSFHGLALTGDESSTGAPVILPPFEWLGGQFPFQRRIVAKNNPTSYGASGLPTGLTVDATTGVVRGTPTQAGTFNVTLTVANANGSSSAPLTLVILAPPAITSAPMASATNGAAFSYQITAANSPTSYGASGLPTGLSVDTATGLISGTPTQTGVYNVTLTAVNASGSGSATLVLTVQPPLPSITSSLTATGITGTVFSYQIVATNTPTSYGASGLPTGLSVDTATGLISGTPTQAAVSSVTISATNGGGTRSATLGLTIATPYAAWQSRMFTAAELANPAVSGDMATPMNDGVPNLIKYALNLSPKAVAMDGLPVVSIGTAGDGQHLQLSFTGLTTATDITYVPEVSGDMQTWSSGAGAVSVVGVVNNADETTQTVTVQDGVPMNGAGSRFIRLRIVKP